jgi:hypothetical protein
VYEEPFGAQQKKGPTPLGTLIGDPEEALSPDDNRMQQVVFSGNLLYSTITSTIFDGSEFVYCPAGVHKYRQADGQPENRHYLTVKGENLIYPAIGISDDNQGVMVFTLAGPNFFPSAAFVRINENGAQGEVHVAAEGVAPDDGSAVTSASRQTYNSQAAGVTTPQQWPMANATSLMLSGLTVFQRLGNRRGHILTSDARGGY